MGGSFKAGRAFGIDIKIHWTFLLLLVFFAFLGYRDSGSAVGALVTAAVVVVLFFCVLLHEFGHSLVAQRLGLEVPDITLLPIGGLARLKRSPHRPLDEVKIAIAGPLLTFVLAVFNLIPAFPMDGGRVLRGLLAIRLGPVRATDISSGVGQFFGIVFILIGLFINPLLALIGLFILLGAGGESQMVRQREMMRGLNVSDVMGTKPRTETVTPYHNFGQVLDSVLHGYQEDFPVVDEGGNIVGIVTRNEILAAAHSPDRYASVRDLMKTDVPTISPDADLFKDGYRILQESGLRALPVTKNGELVGMLTVDDVGQASLLRDLRKQQY